LECESDAALRSARSDEISTAKIKGGGGDQDDPNNGEEKKL